jgi:hypothetical protein
MSDMSTSRHISSYAAAALEDLVSQSQLTTAGRNWLIGATDPFHDVDFDPEGFPDTECAATITQLVKQSTAIAAPASATGNWDLLIFSTPVHGQTSSVDMTSTGYSITATNAVTSYPTGTGTGAGSSGVGNIMFIAGPAGTVLGPTQTANTPAAATFGVLAPTAYAKGQCRIVGSGFEVTNTTAEINLQGSVTVFRKPCNLTRDILLPSA